MIFGELDALSRIEQHPFIVSLHVAYHDRYLLYYKHNNILFIYSLSIM